MNGFDPASVAVGDELPALDLYATRAAAVRYAGASTDFNPIHWSDRSARELGLDGVIIHGMWTMGSALRVVTNWCTDPARLIDYAVRFTSPVRLPDDDEGTHVRVTARVTEIVDETATIMIDARIPAAAEGEKDTKVLGAARAHVFIGEHA
ncbi:MAG: dehydratase [Propionibacteriaceae bacterium]|jgi:acyl dehydratase|uniref:Fatty-acid synthase n=1 Tax=Propionibacterium ruminifibrarum TaxID=1962131 RepID=A0A375I2A6_9ACTN|nr:MaoC/PaaZ C-terminal domain-containing protein [Propionibacterium ruminifibrarum]MBE6478213.1 dehydratase [Propionibacteriaceae bacterium]SPF68785.1 fatty-acid synthase [Propionibacterium ruminifibrarum]